MGFLDKLLGRAPRQPYQQDYQPDYQQGYQPGYAPATGPQDSTTGATAQDRAAIARYRYLLRTAPPEQIEEAHAQAFAQLSPTQRQQILQEMTQTLPASEQPQSADPRQMARAATRAEMQRPGYLQSTFGGRGYGGGMGGGMMGAFGGSLLGTIAGVVIGTTVADAMLGGFDGSPEQQDVAAGGDGSVDASGAEAGDASGAGSGDSGAVAGGDPSGGDASFGDFGGGDFGGGDFGGGDFGGGDFGGF